MKAPRVGKLLFGVWLAAGSSAFAQAAEPKIQRVLHYWKVAGHNHRSGIEGCTKALDNLAEQYGFSVTHTDNEADLLSVSQYDVLVFDNNVSNGGAQGVLPSTDAQQAVIDYLEGGGAYLGFHGASDYDCTGWNWYYKTLFSGNCFKGHGGGSWTLEVDTDLLDDQELSDMWQAAGLGNTVTFSTEKYRFKGSDASVRIDPDVKVMQKMIKSSEDYDDHYFTWTKRIGDGRMLYTALGHGASDFTQNDAWLEKATWYWMLYLKREYDPSVVPVHPSGRGLKNAGMGVESGRLKLYDVNGELVASRTGEVFEGFDYSKMAKSGLYFAKIESPAGIATKKIVIP